MQHLWLRSTEASRLRKNSNRWGRPRRISRATILLMVSMYGLRMLANNRTLQWCLTVTWYHKLVTIKHIKEMLTTIRNWSNPGHLLETTSFCYNSSHRRVWVFNTQCLRWITSWPSQSMASSVVNRWLLSNIKIITLDKTKSVNADLSHQERRQKLTIVEAHVTRC